MSEPIQLYKSTGNPPPFPAVLPGPPPDLAAATSNPWYVLATIFGEQSGADFDPELHKTNRRIWNAWACSGLPEDQRARLADRLKIDVAMLQEWDTNEQAKVESVFRSAGLSIPTPGDEIGFHGSFPHNLDLSGFVFRENTSFGGSRFSKKVRFNGAIFGKKVSFESVVAKECTLDEIMIDGEASFENANFYDGASFKHAAFGKSVRFDYTEFFGNIEFVRTEFKSDVIFYKMSFSDGDPSVGNAAVLFEECYFSGGVGFVSNVGIPVTFQSCNFGQSISISYECHGINVIPSQFHRGFKMIDCSVAAHAIFEETTFKEGAHFARVHFRGLAKFGTTEFHGPVEFVNCEFEEDARFDEANFFKARFNRTRFRGFCYFSRAKCGGAADFSECEFLSPTLFRDAAFLGTFPKLSGAMLHSITSFTAKDDFWPKGVAAPDEESRESLAIIRHAVGKQGLPEEEHYFFRREMAFAARIGSPAQRLPYQLFAFFSDFGHSIAKPTWWLFGIWLFGAALYCWWLTWVGPHLTDAWPGFTAAGFSFGQLFGFLGLSRPLFGDAFVAALPPLLKLVAGAQTVLGVVLLFLLGLALRNRFRLK